MPGCTPASFFDKMYAQHGYGMEPRQLTHKAILLRRTLGSHLLVWDVSPKGQLE